jgi:hypothetical protein
MAFCTNCGTKIEDGIKFCSNCGKALNVLPNEAVAPLIQEQPNVIVDNNNIDEKKKLNTMALIGFIIGLISLLLNFFGIMGIIACIFSGVGLGNFNSKTENNKWMAVIGLLCGIFSVIYGLIKVVELM